MSKALEPILQIFALGIFAVAALFSMPFWLFSMIFLKGKETSVAATEGIPMRFLQSEAVWGCLALVAWISFVAVLQKG
jgi:uncharacterized membrane protein